MQGETFQKFIAEAKSFLMAFLNIWKTTTNSQTKDGWPILWEYEIKFKHISEKIWSYHI